MVAGVATRYRGKIVSNHPSATKVSPGRKFVLTIQQIPPIRNSPSADVFPPGIIPMCERERERERERASETDIGGECVCERKRTTGSG